MGMVRDYRTQIALAGAGRAALALGELAGAKDYQRQALRCPVYWVHDRVEAVATLAQIYAMEGDILRAVELLAFAVAQPAVMHRVRQPMARLLAELEAELPAAQFAAAAACGRARELDDLVAELDRRTGAPGGRRRRGADLTGRQPWLRSASPSSAPRASRAMARRYRSSGASRWRCWHTWPSRGSRTAARRWRRGCGPKPTRAQPAPV